MTDEEFAKTAAAVLATTGAALGGVPGIAMGALAELLPAILSAIKSGDPHAANEGAVVALKKAIVAAADLEMMREMREFK